MPVIDEVDAIGAKRYESQSGGEREIQRTMLELLNQMDGFDARGDVKVVYQLVVQPAHVHTHILAVSVIRQHDWCLCMQLHAYGPFPK